MDRTTVDALTRRHFAMLVGSTLATANVRAATTSPAQTRPWFVPALTVPSHRSTYRAAPAGDGAQAVARLLHWPLRVLALVVKYQQNPLRAARSLAYVHVAMHDAWLHAFERGPLDAACGEIAAHRAASLVLDQLYPNETPGTFEAQYAFSSADLADAPGAPALGCGTQVAARVVQRTLTDGAGRVWAPSQRPPSFSGIWQPTYPLYAANPTEGFAPAWQLWVQPSPARHDPPTAPRPGSARHAAEAREVLEVARTLTPERKRLAEEWNLDAGSVTPAGVWMQRTLALVASGCRGLSQREALRLALTCTAAVSIAMHDAFVACWRVKMRDWSERPITAVRRTLDSSFAPVLITPGFPSYVSGHATVSGAAATVLAGFFPAQATSLAQAAQEAADSRLWGGIHFRADNDEGLRLGQAVGEDVLAAPRSRSA